MQLMEKIIPTDFIKWGKEIYHEGDRDFFK